MFHLNDLIRTNIQSLRPYICARHTYVQQESVFLDANENPYGELPRYPDPQQKALKEALAIQKGLRREQIFVGNGSDEGIDLLYRIFCTPGKDKALTFSPTYGMYAVAAAIHDVNLVEIPLTNTFEIDAVTTSERCAKELFKLTFICSPNNPTGNAVPQETIAAILQQSNGIVVVDEAYIDFCQTESLAQWINTYPNLVVLQTMSKAYGLAAARVGFVLANPQIIELLHRVKPPYNVSTLNQHAALRALQKQAAHTRNVQQVLLERKRLEEKLSALPAVVKVYPSDANFLLVECTDAEKAYRTLLAHNIVVRNRTNQIAQCLRISVGTPDENNKLIHTFTHLDL